MAAKLTDIADAVEVELNRLDWVVPFVSKRQNIPRVNREDLGRISVIVSPKSRVTSRLTRRDQQGDYEIFIGIQKGLRGDGNDETDELIQLGEDIANHFADGVVFSATHATCIDAQFGSDAESPWMAVKDVEEGLFYTGIITLTFRVVQ